MTPVALTVNGSACTGPPESGLTLLLFIRNVLGLKGTRQGCAEGHCGSCTVLVNGRPVQSCQLQLSGLAGAQVVTIEGLGDHPIAAVVRDAVCETRAAQCGYCMSGIIVSATGVLAGVSHGQPPPEALSSHLCRCGTHVRIMQALRLASERLRAGELD